jgi:hypothetical protein
MMITVEEEEHVAAFKDYVLANIAAVPLPPKVEPVKIEPVKVEPVKVEPVMKAAAAPRASEPVAVPLAVAPSTAMQTTPVVSAFTSAWGQSAKVSSPLANTLSKSQSAYIALYGTTGQLPL